MNTSVKLSNNSHENLVNKEVIVVQSELAKNISLEDKPDLFQKGLILKTAVEGMSDNLKQLKELKNGHYKNEDLTRIFSMYSLPAIYFLLSSILFGTLHVMNLHYNHILPLTLGLGGIFVFFSLVFSTTPDMCPRFKWVNKLLMKLPKFNKRDNQYNQYQQSVYKLIDDEGFQHDYLAHIQMKLAQYQEVALEINQSDTRQYHAHHLNDLKDKIKRLQELQSLLVACLVNESHEDKHFVIELIEEKLEKIQALIKEKMQDNASQKSFVEKHQDFLKQKGLTTFLQQTDKNWQSYQEQEARHAEQNLKTLL